jgi:hypothetical protein
MLKKTKETNEATLWNYLKEKEESPSALSHRVCVCARAKERQGQRLPPGTPGLVWGEGGLGSAIPLESLGFCLILD